MIMDVNGMTVPCWTLVPVPSCLAMVPFCAQEAQGDQLRHQSGEAHAVQASFYFGGGASLDCTWTVRLPLCIGGKYGHVQVYLLPCETPMLLGRPHLDLCWTAAAA